MSKVVKFAALQLTKSWDLEDNLEKAKKAIREAAQNGANVILPQELFAAPYFCKKQEAKYFELAEETENCRLIKEMSALAKELGVVIPVSYFEKAGNTFFNSLVMIDADGTVLENYRKSHIPDGPGYSEKYYFSPGDTGFKVWQTKFGKFGAGICWDQWFPELARSLALHGAEAIFYPTAIGSEPQDPTLDSRDHWQRTMQGHSAANLVPVIASNRVGTEVDDGIETTFYGSSFITDHTGAKIAEAPREGETIIYAEIDLEATAKARHAWGLFRDRRPELYTSVGKLAV
ncbi:MULTISPECIES: N-carbamoylputrescine amidase [Vibrio]|jgi:N-carbamoylputrescine amidase|uniref:N-carbamoylputrescine amidase n=1 Tax=Vibrio natriegens NBRC 15636 = ATCC 14048 = DSM 759 TaxID=1219067 RepID=A0AAN1CW18_VIBNA|nr:MULTISPECIES: N-carbamoylputrescine amidase [Vibrio]MEE3877764.1 N-carbamoylputrescine amidase [Vibrio sp. YYF0003]CAH0532030.1 N-carbamoyl-D-amino acid hydrolase [Catenococcus thiocycli]AEX22143.1 carbon-nitrogen hydrolase [Vibrio sp. EJY3]ALR15366.1 carbon-nitrogen hydrolase [Vibrio natriegens NBRC 15636 = ATCC 14048 = DSM 759]ANQ12773.1 N-carbamoylputrescine amidase [Vibrio natriegens NBRC 15636 = ATCC 14048 = DSM 759]